MVFQKTIRLTPYPRGFHLITAEVEKVIQSSGVGSGIVHVFIQHTSASLTLNENADPTVRTDFEKHINQMVPENLPYFDHNYEGSDDMPAHIKASMMGSSVSFPIQDGKPLLGTWQGIYLGEHRNHATGRNLVVTILGTN